MKTMVVLGHPDLTNSHLNRLLLTELKKDKTLTLNILSEKYPDQIADIDALEEQNLLLNHDRIILQFPFYWYSYPTLLKAWLDATFLEGFAYGENGDKLKGKELLLAITTGADEKAYSRDGYMHHEIKELILPIVLTAHMTQMKLYEPFMIYGALKVTEQEINAKIKEYKDFIYNRSLKPLKSPHWL